MVRNSLQLTVDKCGKVWYYNNRKSKGGTKMKNLQFQIEMAIEEVTNACNADKYKMTMPKFISEVYYYVTTTEYTETGMNDKPTSRFYGKGKLIKQIEKQIKADKDAMERVEVR